MKYELVIESNTNAYILDKEENLIVALCNTKRPDLGFEKLKELVQDANKYIPIKLAMVESAENFKKYIEELNVLKENNPQLYRYIVDDVLSNSKGKTNNEKVARLAGFLTNNYASKTTIPLEELDFSVRTYNCLYRAGIRSLGDIAEMTIAELYRIRGIRKNSIDKRSAEEVLDRLKEFGIELK